MSRPTRCWTKTTCTASTSATCGSIMPRRTNWCFLTSKKGVSKAAPEKCYVSFPAYTQHGQIEIGNDLVENAIRPLVIRRKNYLFAGSHHAAEMTAAMYSFMSTCKKNLVNEMAYRCDGQDSGSQAHRPLPAPTKYLGKIQTLTP